MIDNCPFDPFCYRKVVRMGDHDLESTEDDATAENYKVLQIIRHEDYNRRSFENDIALLKLDRDVTYTAEIHPICLPITPGERTRNLTNAQPFVGGWGTVEFSKLINGDQLFCARLIIYCTSFQKERRTSTLLCFRRAFQQRFAASSSAGPFKWGVCKNLCAVSKC